MAKPSDILQIESISQLHRQRGLPAPQHPLISLVDIGKLQPPADFEAELWLSHNFYTVSVKRGMINKINYGHTQYDFDEGVLSLLKPYQTFSVKPHPYDRLEGWMLVFSLDLLAGYPLAQKILSYGFFSYQLNEALHLSQAEEASLQALVRQIEEECSARLDGFSQNVIVSCLDLLLTYVDRYYSRQFLTRKRPLSDTMSRIDTLLSTYIDDGSAFKNGLPTVGFVADHLGLSQTYLNDMVKSLTSHSVGAYIDLKLLEQAKLLLSHGTTQISTIGYELGFQHSQSFNRFFKKHENLSPSAFRKRIN